MSAPWQSIVNVSTSTLPGGEDPDSGLSVITELLLKKGTAQWIGGFPAKVTVTLQRADVGIEVAVVSVIPLSTPLKLAHFKTCEVTRIDSVFSSSISIRVLEVASK